MPDKPGAWLVTTARNRAIDRIRRDRALAEKIHLLQAPAVTMEEFDDAVIKDERLEPPGCRAPRPRSPIATARMLSAVSLSPAPETRRRLVEAKRSFDPENLFRQNFNIPPEATP